MAYHQLVVACANKNIFILGHSTLDVERLNLGAMYTMSYNCHGRFKLHEDLLSSIKLLPMFPTRLQF